MWTRLPRQSLLLLGSALLLTNAARDRKLAWIHGSSTFPAAVRYVSDLYAGPSPKRQQQVRQTKTRVQRAGGGSGEADGEEPSKRYDHYCVACSTIAI